MADNRTELSAADIAESFRDRCGDGSVEWVYTPMQTWVLLDAADMLDENAKLRELVRTLHHCAARGECDVCAMRDGRGLDEDTVCLAMHDRMRELGVDA